MNKYQERMQEIYDHKPSCTMLDYLQLKTELEYKTIMLNNANDTYEKLIQDLASGNEVKIGNKVFRLEQREETK